MDEINNGQNINGFRNVDGVFSSPMLVTSTPIITKNYAVGTVITFSGSSQLDELLEVMIKTFVELLGIRDTIQAPVLMCENKDETMAQFFIPTNTKILYTFVIKVDNYDEIYGESEEIVYDALDEEIVIDILDEEVVEDEPTPDETPVDDSDWGFLFGDGDGNSLSDDVNLVGVEVYGTQNSINSSLRKFSFFFKYFAVNGY